jgi:hypothetical protein
MSWLSGVLHGYLLQFPSDVHDRRCNDQLSVRTPMKLGGKLRYLLEHRVRWRRCSPNAAGSAADRETYAVARYFYWQSAYPEPAYHHKIIRDFYSGLELKEFKRARTISGAFLQLRKMTGRAWAFYVAPVLTLPLFLLPKIMRDRRIRFLLIAGAAGLVSSALVIFFNINYLVPIVPMMLAVILQGMRHLRAWHWNGRPTGQFLVRAMVVMCILMIPVQAHILAAAPEPGTSEAIGPERAALEAQLRSLPGPQLVLVRYGPNHDPLLDWVYNGADIDRQKVVWARDMGAAQNEELLRYYSDRLVWLLEADGVSPRLLPYADKPPQIK